MSQTPRNESIKISTDGIYRGVTVHVPYPLEYGDYLKLTKVNSLLPIWAHAFFTGTILFIITVLAKWINKEYYNGTEIVTQTEWITLVILAVLAIVFELLYLCLPSDKKKTISKIEKHFEEHTPQAAGFTNE